MQVSSPVQIHEYVLSQLVAAKGRWPAIAKEAGVSKRTLEKIARGEIRDPGVRVIQKLADHFLRLEGVSPTVIQDVPDRRVNSGDRRHSARSK